ncbi:juvenile hormone epoxide hydrolase 1-like [Schistocerca piceifrons]|uniref:juvenile hormone epoxide hydrolase 1-like n=1 Tax=Schistocerca piceifrons TaxID=274613 RepID=UPI001F5FE0CF|nr:juvenile hormone epoxide hydrolase 1-like [Schistocerca piceifrons]
MCCCEMVLVLVLAAILAVFVWKRLTAPEEEPFSQRKLEDAWWGPGEPREVDESVRPFSIDVPDSVIQDLHEKLKSTPKLTPPLEGVGFEYGFNSEYLKEVVEFWRTQYDWREREKFLNQFPQFKTTVSGLELHFIHAKPAEVPQGTVVVPLLLLHGWPGSVREFYSLLPLLTTPRKGEGFVFEVVAPSLPGYGFSQGAAKPGFGTVQMAAVMKKLMERLGHNKFYVQGGDWGSAVGTALAKYFPSYILGLHVNMCSADSLKARVKATIGGFWPTLFVERRYARKAFPYWKNFFNLVLQEMGYMHLQASKPDTIGIALQTTPVGLAAYILEKFSTWTDPSWKTLPDGGLTKKYELADLLDNVMIYWVTGSITTSVRLYSEAFSKAAKVGRKRVIEKYPPTAVAQFENDLVFTPESMARDAHPGLVRYSVYRGGHFAAFEEPKALADDVWDFVKSIRA